MINSFESVKLNNNLLSRFWYTVAGVDIFWPITSFDSRVVIKSSRTAFNVGPLVITQIKMTAVSVWVETINFANTDC